MDFSDGILLKHNRAAVDLRERAVVFNDIVFVAAVNDHHIEVPVRRRTHNRARDGEAALGIGDFVVGGGHVVDDLGAVVGEVHHAEAGVLAHGEGVLIGDGHLNRRGGLHLLAVLQDCDVEEAREGHGVAGNAQPGRGIAQIAFVGLGFGQDFADEQLRPRGNRGALVVVQRDFEGLAVKGLVTGFQGIAQDKLREIVGGEGEAGHAVQAVLVLLAVQLQVFSQVDGVAVLHLIQLEVRADHRLVQADGHLKAVVVLGVHVVEVDIEHTAGGVAVGGQVRRVHHFGNRLKALLGGGQLGLDAGVLGQVHGVHGADHHGVVLRAHLGDAGGVHRDGVGLALGHGDGQGLPALDLLHGADGPIALARFHAQHLGIGDFDRRDARREISPFALGHDAQRAHDRGQRHVLRAGDGILKVALIRLGLPVFRGVLILRLGFALPGLVAGLGVRVLLQAADQRGLRRFAGGGPIALAAGQRLDMEGDAVDDHALSLGAGQHALDRVAFVGVGVRARAFLQAAGQHALDAVACVAMGVRARALLQAADQHVLVGTILGVLVRLRTEPAALIAGGVVHMARALLQAAGQRALLDIAGVAVLVAGVFLQAADQRGLFRVTAVVVMMGPLFAQAADQVARGIIAIRVVAVVVFALHDAADQLARRVATGVGVPVGRQMAHVLMRRRILRRGGFVARLGVDVLLKPAQRRFGRPAVRRLRQREGQVRRNQHQHRQQQRQKPLPLARIERGQHGIAALFHLPYPPSFVLDSQLPL